MSPSLTMYSLPSSRCRCLALASLSEPACVEVVECGDLGANKSLGEVGVDLAGGLDGGRPALEVPAAHLGLSGGEERDDAHCVVGLADDPISAQLADAQVGHERRAFIGFELRELELELGVDGECLGRQGCNDVRDAPGPWIVFKMATCGLSVNSPNDRSGFLSSAESSSVGDRLAVFEGGLHDLDDCEFLWRLARGRAGLS